jgi:short-subunit dehydrogenase
MNSSGSQQRVAVVTGASSGIGARTAIKLAERGYLVVGAARRVDLIERLPGIHAVSLDLADPASVSAAARSILAGYGAADLLVNNAGYGEFGSVEETSIDDARRQFEVNLFGLVRLTQLLLPGMRDAGRGRIVNVSSLAGRFASPMGGWYHASKFALEALSDSLRAEVRPFGLQVAVVEPGPVRTGWHDEAISHLEVTSASGPYADQTSAVARFLRASEQQQLASTPDQVADVIVTAATVPRPKTRYTVGRGASTAIALGRYLPDRTFDWLTRRQFGLA